MFIILLLISLFSVAIAEDQTHKKKRAYFGDLHVHTHLSLDASIQGTQTTPKQAYEFAKGRPIKPFGKAGVELKIGRPLDFAAITDHAELLGEKTICNTQGLKGHYSLSCLLYRHWPSVGFIWMNMSLSRRPWFGSVPRLAMCGWGGKRCRDAAIKPWNEIKAAAESANEPGRFTAFVAYEWTGSPQAKNWHRNVIFNDQKNLALPVSYFEAHSPEKLWQALSDQCNGTCQYVTIPHNSNLSDGLMFPKYDSETLGQNAALRNQNEPLIEIFQHKGDSECGPTSPDERCAQFEKLPYNNLAAERFWGILSKAPSDSDFVQSALIQGIEYASIHQVNPYQYGFTSNTDTHLGTPGLVSESDFPGHGGNSGKPNETGLGDDPKANPGGLTGIWAESNTRRALFEGLKRKETFATTGPRIQLRLRVGESLNATACNDTSFLNSIQVDLHPMGSTVSDQTIKILIEAKQDPLSAPLETIELVKGWTENGKGKLKTITLQTVVRNDHGICAYFEDKLHDSSNAFYYARALERPTKRWTERKCRIAKIDCHKPTPSAYRACCNPEIPQMIQERAWSSPIWRTPKIKDPRN